MVLRGGLVMGTFFFTVLVSPLILAADPCERKLFKMLDFQALKTFERRAWFASENSSEQAEVFKFLIRQGIHQRGPLHPIEIRRWQEFRRDILNHYKRHGESLSSSARAELDSIVSELILRNILAPSLELAPGSSLDQKLNIVLEQVQLQVRSLDRSPEESLPAPFTVEPSDLEDEGLWELIVRLYEAEGKRD